jgi:WD40 repeat protein
MKTGQTRGVFRGPTAAIRCLAFSPDEKRLVAGSGDGLLSIWDVEKGQTVGIYRGLAGVASAIFTADGRRVQTLEAGPSLRSWDATHGAEVQVFLNGALHTAISPDGKMVAAAWSDVHLWDTQTSQKIRTFEERGESAEMTAFSPDGTLLAGAMWHANSGGVKVWNVKTGEVVRPLPDLAKSPTARCTVVAFSPDGKFLAAGGVDRMVRVSRVDTGEEVYRLGVHTCTVTGLEFTRDSKRLISLSGGSTFQVAPTEPNPLQLVSDDRNAIPDLKVWDMATGQELRTISLPGKVDKEFGLSPDGEIVSIGLLGNILRSWSLSSGEVVGEIQGRTGVAVGVAFSPDGRRTVSLGQEGDISLRLCDWKTGEELIILGKHPSRGVSNVAFSADGHKIVSASVEDIRVWDARPLPQ